jgi:hypothetical protein
LIRWDHKTKARAEITTPDDPMMEGLTDLAKDMKDFDPYDDCSSEIAPPPRRRRKSTGSEKGTEVRGNPRSCIIRPDGAGI